MKIRVLIAAFFLLFLVISLTGKSFAQEDYMMMETEPSPTINLETTATPTPTMNVDYTLPYPGLLPDNPLYILKAARDKIIEFLISDSVKKAEFYLLSSDKRLNTGYYLIAKNKDDMGVLYVSKSNNYMDMAIGAAKNSGERGKSTLDQISTAIKKHKEIIKKLESSVDKKNKTSLQNELAKITKSESLLKKK